MADTKISALSAVTTPVGTDEFAVNQSSVSKKETLTQVQTFVKKKRVTTAADASSITPNSDNEDITYQLNTQAAGTLTINADGGTPTNGQAWILKIKSTNAQTLSWNGVYVGGTVALPSATSGSSKIDYYTFIYDSVASKWDYTGTATGFVGA